MVSTTQELIETLDELAAVLESDGNRHWSLLMRKAAGKLKNGDDSGADYLLQAYGGLGSLNDLILGQTHENGTFAWKQNYVALNERFEALRSRAWQLAKDVRLSCPDKGQL